MRSASGPPSPAPPSPTAVPPLPPLSPLGGLPPAGAQDTPAEGGTSPLTARKPLQPATPATLKAAAAPAVRENAGEDDALPSAAVSPHRSRLPAEPAEEDAPSERPERRQQQRAPAEGSDTRSAGVNPSTPASSTCCINGTSATNSNMNGGSGGRRRNTPGAGTPLSDSAASATPAARRERRDRSRNLRKTRAAIRLQAAYRGKAARKRVKEMRRRRLALEAKRALRWWCALTRPSHTQTQRFLSSPRARCPLRPSPRTRRALRYVAPLR